MLKVFTPSQLKNKLVLSAHAMHPVHVLGHIGHAQNAMRQIRRQHADRALHMVACLRIFERL